MYDFQESHETHAPAEAVWAVYADVRGWPRWSAQLESVSFGGPFENGAAGEAVVQIGIAQSIPFHLENVVPNASFDVVWSVGHLLTTRMTHLLERSPSGGTRIMHRYHTGGVMAPFNFLQAAAAHDRVFGAMAAVARLAEGG